MSDDTKPGVLADHLQRMVERKTPDLISAVRHLASAQMDCSLALMILKVALDDNDSNRSQEAFDTAIKAFEKAQSALTDIGL